MALPVLVTIGVAMAGAGIVAEGVKRGSNAVLNPKIAGIVGGAADTVKAVADPLNLAGTPAKLLGAVDVPTWLDPFDLSGTQKRKAQKAQDDINTAQNAAASEKDKRRAAEKAAKAATKKAEAAEKKAAADAKKAADLEKRGRDKEAELAKQQAALSERWATMTKSVSDKALELAKTNGDKALAMAQVALDTAKKAVDPPATAADAMTDDMSDAAKGVVANMVDAVNRFAGDDEIDLMVASMADEADGFGVIAGRNSRHSHAVAGSCCASCSLTGSSCGKGAVPPEMINGPELFGESDGSDLLDPEDGEDDAEIFGAVGAPSHDDDGPGAAFGDLGGYVDLPMGGDGDDDEDD